MKRIFIWLALFLFLGCKSQPNGERQEPQPAAGQGKEDKNNPSASAPSEQPNAGSGLQGILTWPRMESRVFGCLMEKQLGHKDPRFNCSLKDEVEKGDPCKNTKAYYDGPQFPASLLSKLHPDLESINLSWEHAELQNVTFVFKDKQDERAIKALLGIPEKTEGVRDNILSVQFEKCGESSNCLSLVGFEHMGAGEVECP